MKRPKLQLIREVLSELTPGQMRHVAGAAGMATVGVVPTLQTCACGATNTCGCGATNTCGCGATNTCGCGTTGTCVCGTTTDGGFTGC